jgi:hypothetical protein
VAKLDVARFMFLEAAGSPTIHRTVVVIGGVVSEAAAQSGDNLRSSGSATYEGGGPSGPSR